MEKITEKETQQEEALGAYCTFVPLRNLSHLGHAAMMARLPKTVSEWLSKIGTKGGRVTSPAKAAAVRENGKLGGRPRKKKATR